jgi:hypothetical protein
VQGAFAKLLALNFVWPEKGDKLFSPPTGVSTGALIHPHSSTRLIYMAEGYRIAANLLVKHCIDHVPDRDLVVYPIVFCYRHFLELTLKWMLQAFGYTVGMKPNWKDHDLATLWKQFKAMPGEYGAGSQDEGDAVVADLLAEFAKVDQWSFAFRYAHTTKGEPMPMSFDSLDVGVLRDGIEQISSYFMGCDGYLTDLQGAIPNYGPDG